MDNTKNFNNKWVSIILENNSQTKNKKKFSKQKKSFLLVFIILIITASTITTPLSSQETRTTETAITLSQQADEELDRKNYLEAISLFKDAIDLNENYVPARAGLAKAYYYLENYERSYIEIEKAKQIDRNSIVVLIWSAKINIKLENFIEAKEELDAAFGIDARNFDLLMTYGEYYREIGRYSESIRYFDLASGTNGESVEPLIAKGNTYLMINRTQEAYQSYMEALERNQRNAEVYYSLANLYYNINNIKKALEYIENAVIIDPYTNKYLELNYKMLFMNNKWDNAELILKQLINYTSPKAEYYDALGIALAKQGEYEESVNYLNEGTERFRGDEVLRWRTEMTSLEGLKLNHKMRSILSKYRYDMGVFYRDRNNIDKALLMINRAIKIQPENLNYRYELADIYKELGFYDRYYQMIKFIKNEDPQLESFSSLIKRYIRNDLQYYERKLRNNLSGKLNIDQYKQRSYFNEANPKIVISTIELDAESESYYESNQVVQDMIYRALANYDTFTVEILDENKVRNETDELNKMDADLVIKGTMKENGDLLTIQINLLNVYNGITLFSYESSKRGNDRFLDIAMNFAEKISNDIPVIGNIRDKKEDEVILNIGTLQDIEKDDLLYVIGNEHEYHVYLRNKENFTHDNLVEISKATIQVNIVDEKILKGTIIDGDKINSVNVNNYVAYIPEYK